MTTSTTEGTVGVSITAGHLTPTDRQPTSIGKQLWMGKDGALAIHITPDVARQWIGVLETIAKDGE